MPQFGNSIDQEGPRMDVKAKMDIGDLPGERNEDAHRQVDERNDATMHTKIAEISGWTAGETNDRRGAPLLEEYRFVPYIDSSTPKACESLKQYASDCFNYTLRHLEEWVMKDENSYVPNKEILIDVLAGQRAIRTNGFENLSAGADCGLAKGIQKLFQLPLSPDMSGKVNSLLNDSKDIFYCDKLLASLHADEILKPCLDIVAENIDTDAIQALEIGGVQNAMHSSIMSLATKTLSKPIIYKVAHAGFTAEFPENISALKQDHLERNSALPDQTVDLLILNHFLHKQENIDTTLETISQLLKPGGFLLVKEITGSFSLCLVMEALSDATEYPRTRGDRIYGRYLNTKAWSALFSRHGFQVVYERTDGVFANLYLLRKQKLYVSAASPVLFDMSDLHFSWLENLCSKMRKMETSVEDTKLWLHARTEVNGITGFLNCLRLEPGGDQVRGIFISNLKPSSPVPQVSTGSAEFQWIARRDLTQNVFRDGVWGSFRHIPLPTELQDTRVSCDPSKSYIIVTGSDNPGLQELGPELIHWLVNKGAQKILLCHRCRDKGIDMTDQATKLTQAFQNTCVHLEVSSRDVTTVDGAWGLVNQAQTLAPLGGLFHLQSVTGHGLFQRQTRESFQVVFDQKVQGTVNLDHVTRSLCRESLDWFIVFSSTWAGRGKPGLTNSGFSSAIVERICERRQADKLPGLAIQLGSLAGSRPPPCGKNLVQSGAHNVGVSLSAQDVPRCLNAMDVLLTQGSRCPVMSCVVEGHSQ